MVECESGMVVASAGPGSLVPAAEAASDHWNLQRRREHFAPFGASRAQVLIQESARITLTPCGARFVLVSFSAEPDRVAWAEWKALAAQLHQLALGL
jgi:hypothetical protein